MFDMDNRPIIVKSVVESADSGIGSANSTADSALNPLRIGLWVGALILLYCLETYYGGRQKAVPDSYPRIPHVVSKPDSNHGTATMAHRTLGLKPTGTIRCSDLSLSYYPILMMYTNF